MAISFVDCLIGIPNYAEFSWVHLASGPQKSLAHIRSTQVSRQPWAIFSIHNSVAFCVLAVVYMSVTH